MPRLSEEHKFVLRSMLKGSQLKSHRYLDGVKVYRLHAVEDNNQRPVEAATVESLNNLGLIRSNMKFPAATYLLTQAGADTAAQLDKTPGASKSKADEPAAPPAAVEVPAAETESETAASSAPAEKTAEPSAAKPKRSRKKS
jgi:hypothetical protein